MTSADILANFKKRPIGYSCGLICLVVGAMLYLTSDKIDENQADYETKSAEAAKILANVRNSENLPKQVAELQALSKEMEGRLIRSGNLAGNLQYFYKLEAENEVKLLEVHQGNPGKPGKTMYVGIPFTCTVQGSFKQVVAFLQHLETGPHFCHFTNASFTKAGTTSTDASGAVTGDMTLTLSLELLGLP